ncbi:hypothetical protein [Hymenobacter chitinivorans]|uniref:EamA-like transporter family protein n=1 Tax=Hymenobacter chitinivorans DSM 11115 TaxID=1121954 RepID=A0A2M9BQ31_9BACT|nr:hypothetical protein [Hymenobacter chitinivorans]PJJ60079.1 hypothetical protein CLV45_1504 [Hymenobacter chitinivorans DSM 11115]
MLALFLSVFCSVCIVFIFKYFARFGVDTFQALIVNYGTCVVVGWLASGRPSLAPVLAGGPWLAAAVALGGLFIGTFYLVALTAQRVGVSAASVANKMSLILPVLLNLLVLRLSQRPYTFINYAGMALALLAILLTALPRRAAPAADSAAPATPAAGWWLPVLLFVSSGAGDSLLNFASSSLLPDAATRTLFPLVTFGTAGIIGLLLLLSRGVQAGQSFAPKNLVAGFVLGIPNYFSIYFLILALGNFGNDGAFVYPVANVATILLGAVGAGFLFREQLGTRGRVGLATAVVALMLISYQEIVAVF